MNYLALLSIPKMRILPNSQFRIITLQTVAKPNQECASLKIPITIEQLIQARVKLFFFFQNPELNRNLIPVN